MTTRIPARVAADAAQADVQLAELAAAANPTPAPAPAEVPPPAPAPTEVVPPAPAPPAPAPAAPPAAVVQPVPDVSIELRRLRDQLNTTQGRLESVLTDNASLKSKVEQMTAAPPTPPQPAVAAVTAEERKDFGEDLINLIEKICNGLAVSRINDLGVRVAQLEGKVGAAVQQVQQVKQVSQQTVADRYFNQLQSEVADWEQINTEQGFLDWLENVDTFSGKPIGVLLADAHQKAEADRVIAIFKRYKAEKGIGTPAAPPAPPAPPAAPAPAVDPATLAAPATTAPAPPPSNNEPGVRWTQDMVDKLYADKQKGRLTPTDFAAKEADYLRELAAGRVVVTQ